MYARRVIINLQRQYNLKVAPCEKVWSRFEVKRKDGTLLKLRTQDVPRARVDDAVEVIMKHFFAEGVVHKAVGVSKDAESYAVYKKIVLEFAAKPSSSIIICCADEDEIKEIMGVSFMLLIDESGNDFKEKVKNNGTPLLKKLMCIFEERNELFDPAKEYGLKKFYEDICVCVVPEFRGLGIPLQFIKARHWISEAHGIPLAGAWMTAYGSQIVGARGGWKTAKELSYDYFGKKHGITFVDAPPTMKYMMPNLEYLAKRKL